MSRYTQEAEGVGFEHREAVIRAKVRILLSASVSVNANVLKIKKGV